MTDLAVASTEGTLEDWVQSKTQEWRDHYEANYREIFDEYYRLWRGQWTAEDATRKSERSRIISPALMQAVESSVAEMEEATFAKGRFFDIEDDFIDEDGSDVAFLRNKLGEDFEKMGVARDIGEVLTNAAIYGTGIAEVVLEQIQEMKPATEQIEGGLTAIGVNITPRTVVTMAPVMPQHFLIDPVATTVQNALGCAIESYVGIHTITALQESGVYLDVSVGFDAPDINIEPDKELATYADDKVLLTKYFGLVPRELLDKAELSDDEEFVSLSDDDSDSEFVEAIVIIANGTTLLKAERNPYMMGDRPIVAFQWDVVPSVFWGRGVCEKGYMSQKALDAELRARIDALALTVHPMMAIDATRIPRGHKPTIAPGKMLLTNGNPSEVLHPFNFGQVNQITFAQAGELTKMVQTATGAIDSAGMAVAAASGDGTAAGISMSLGAAMKRHKRTLINFHSSFLVPFVEKAAWRYMQFDPENYPVDDYKFVARGTLGMIAREYEVTQLVQLLQTTPQDSPAYPALLEAVVENMNISNREELVALMKEAQKPNPEAEAAQKAAMEIEVELKKAQTRALNAEAAKDEADAAKKAEETKWIEEDAKSTRIKAVAVNIKDGDADDKEFEKRLRIAEFELKREAADIVTPEEAGVRASLGDAIQSRIGV